MNGCNLRVAVYAAAIAAGCFDAAAQETNRSEHPIDLPTTLRLAGAQNLDVQIARERTKEARAGQDSAVLQFFPWISPGIGYHRRDGEAQAVPSGVISDAHFQSYSPGVSLTAQIPLGDAIYNSLAAKQLVKASDQALETQRQEAILVAARSYFELVKLRAMLDVVKQAIQLSEDYEQQLHAGVASGVAFRGDELRVQTQTEQYRLAHSAMDPLVERALHRRPELRESQALIAAARQNKKGAVYGPLVPSVGAQVFGGGLGGGPDGGPSDFGAEGDYAVGLSWRIGPGGLFDSGRVNGTKARLAAVELTDIKLKDAIVSDVVKSLVRVNSMAAQIRIAERNLNTANETFRLTRERKQFGVGIVLEDPASSP